MMSYEDLKGGLTSNISIYVFEKYIFSLKMPIF